MHQNVSLGSNGVDWVHSLRKIMTRLRGTNFSTSSACFVPSSVRQPNGPDCTQIVRNAQKCLFRVQMGESGAFVAKNSDATSWHILLHFSAHFAPSFVRQPYGPGCTQIVRHTPKCQFRVQWGGSGAFVAKQPNSLECTQIVRNAPKRQFRAQWGRSGSFVANNSEATSRHELLH